MKILTILISLFVFSLTVAQKNADLDFRVKALTSLLLDPTEAGLREISSPKITYGHSNSLIEDQNTFITALVSGKADYVKINVKEQTIDITGKTGIVRQVMDVETASTGTTNNLFLKVLLVWAKEKGKWILVARQAVRIPQQ